MANSKIRGITIEIGGDTTKLDKALGSVDKKVKGTQVELREVNKLLKIDPTNTEMLAQKQALLTDAISETKEKLDILKNAESQVQEQFKKGEVSEEQYKALKRELGRTEWVMKFESRKEGGGADRASARRSRHAVLRRMARRGGDGAEQSNQIMSGVCGHWVKSFQAFHRPCPASGAGSRRERRC